MRECHIDFEVFGGYKQTCKGVNHDSVNLGVTTDEVNLAAYTHVAVVEDNRLEHGRRLEFQLLARLNQPVN